MRGERQQRLSRCMMRYFSSHIGLNIKWFGGSSGSVKQKRHQKQSWRGKLNVESRWKGFILELYKRVKKKSEDKRRGRGVLAK